MVYAPSSKVVADDPANVVVPATGSVLGPVKLFLAAVFIVLFFLLGLALSAGHLKGGEVVITFGILLIALVVGLGSGYLAVRFLFKHDHDQAHVALMANLASFLNYDFADFKVDLDSNLSRQAAFNAQVTSIIEKIPAVPRSLAPDIERILSAGVIGTIEDVREYERTAACSEIWVVTKDLHYDVALNEGDVVNFGQVVLDNIRERAIRYRYFVPDNTTARVTVEQQFRPRFTEEENQERLMIRFLTPDGWEGLPWCDGDFAIYVPSDAAKDHLFRAYMEIPLTDRRLWIKLNCDMARDWFGRINESLSVLTPSTKKGPH